MDDRRIEVLLSAVQTGSFNKAATREHCSQSAVTQLMNSLEDELGVKVLNRSHAGITLTPEGEELLPLFVEADDALRRLAARAKRVKQDTVLPVRIGAFSSVSNRWLPRAISEYQQRHPEAAFEVRVGTDSVSDWLLAGEIDLALGDAERCRGFRWHPLVDDPYYAVMPASWAPAGAASITQDELVKRPFIMATCNALAAYLSPKPASGFMLTCDDDTTVLSMVAQGLGVTAMPELSLQNVPDSVRVLKLEPPVARQLGIALPNSPRPAAVRFAEFLQKEQG